jgi:type VI secretion system protein ImpL
MVSLRRLFGLILLFLFFEVVVAVLARLIEVSPLWACLAMTGLAILIWVVYVTINWFLTRPRETPPQASTDAPAAAPVQPAKPASSVKDEELSALLREANDRLAAAPINSGQRVKWTVETLPLYLIVGLDGVGKTSTLFNSGVDAKLLAGESYRESSVVPTKLCNFWLAANAVFVDVSGRVFSEAPDRWENVLRTLGSRRKTSLLTRLWHGSGGTNNLRGAVLVCDTNALIGGPDPEKLAVLSRKLQDRLQVIGAAFSSDFPVYVLFTKSDAIPYFGEFFGHLSETEDQRILGATLPAAPLVEPGTVYAEAETKRLTSYVNRLYAALADKRLIVLAREDTAGKRPFVYEFPRELKRIRGDVVRFLVDIFRPNPLLPSPKLRGFYFSGIRKVASSASLGEKPDEFSVARSGADATVFFKPGASALTSHTVVRPASSSEPGVTRWSFLSELFQNVILRDHAPSAPRAGRFELYRNVAFATVALIGLIFTFGFLRSGWGNHSLLKEVDATVASVSRNRPSGLSLQNVQDLETLRAQLAPLIQYEHEAPPRRLRWGLYSGDKVLEPLRNLYFARFRKVILDPILGAMSTRFGQLSPGASSVGYQEIYDQIKVYRTATSGKCSADKTLLDRVLPHVWPALQAADPELQVMAIHQIQFYTSELVGSYGGQIPEKEPERKQAQAYLLSFKGPDKVLRGLLEEVNRTQEAADLSKYAPNHQSVLTGPGRMDAAYTRVGWDIVQKRIQEGKFASAGDPCVLGASAELGSLAKAGTSVHEIQDLYVREYIKRWKIFLQSEGIVNFGRADAAEKLQLLSNGNRSYLLALIFMISENTNIGTTGEKNIPNPIGDQAKNSRIGSFFQRNKKVAQEIQQAVAPQSAQPLAVPADIGKDFQPVRATVDPSNSQSWLNGKNGPYITALGELAAAMGPLVPRANSAVDPQAYVTAHAAVSKAWANVQQLEADFNNTPDGIDLDLRTLVEAPIKRADDLIPREPGREEANAGARNLCAKFERLRRKYPFNPNTADEVSIDELKTYFAPVIGELAQFTKRAPFDKLLTKSGSTWTQTPGTQPALAQQFVVAFNALAQLSDALFPGGSAEPKVAYTILVTSPSRKIQAIRVTVDGHSTPIDNVREQFLWPSTGGQSGARVDITVSGVSIPIVPPYLGPWGIFRMLQNADSNSSTTYVFSKIRQGTRDRGGVSEPLVDADGKSIEVDVQVETQVGPNVFAKDYFSGLKCWQRAAQ